MSGLRHTHAMAVRFSALGDVVLATGVLDYWHRSLGLTFTFLTRERFSPILENHPAVREVIGLSESTLSGLSWVRRAASLAWANRGLPLVDLHGSLRSRILRLAWRGDVHAYPKYSKTRRRYLKHRRRPDAETLLSASVPQRYALALQKPKTAPPPPNQLQPVIRLREKEREQGRECLEKLGLGRPVIALHPYATHPAKAWAPDQWHTLAGMLDAAGLDWVVLGAGSLPLEWPRPGRDLSGRTTLRQTCAILAACRALVTGDSGPMHLATAVGTPVVALFGPTTRHWGFFPSGPRDLVLERKLDCRPCSLHGGSRCPRSGECLGSIGPQEVAEAAMDLS